MFLHVLASGIQLSGDNPNVPPLGTIIGIGMIVAIIVLRRRGR